MDYGDEERKEVYREYDNVSKGVGVRCEGRRKYIVLTVSRECDRWKGGFAVCLTETKKEITRA